MKLFLVIDNDVLDGCQLFGVFTERAAAVAHVDKVLPRADGLPWEPEHYERFIEEVVVDEARGGNGQPDAWRLG